MLQLFYIFRLKRQQSCWLDTLRSVRAGDRQRLFVKGKGKMASICQELNGIMDADEQKAAKLQEAETNNKRVMISLFHDVHTPLASLIEYLGTLEKNIPGAGEKEYVSEAFWKAEDLRSSVDLLFEWVKLNSPEQQFTMETADINEMTRESLTEWGEILGKANITLFGNISEEQLPISIDKGAYRRILDNLIQNAAENEGCTCVTVSVRSDDKTAQLEVANNGQAIDENQLPYIFDQLHRGDSPYQKKGKGLRLAITNQMVATMQGTLSVVSEQAKDTSFFVMLPLVK